MRKIEKIQRPAIHWSAQGIRLFSVVCIGALLYFSLNQAHAARISDVRNTKHNFSADIIPNLPGSTVRAVGANTEPEICVFCHTPHGGNISDVDAQRVPLWNRQLSSSNAYTTYQSGSIDAPSLSQPGTNRSSNTPMDSPQNVSKLCLSCHDGTIAIGAVNVLNGTSSGSAISMTGTASGNMPVGAGETSGYTRRIGQNLTNDHPISMVYNDTLVTRDLEMYLPGSLLDDNGKAFVGVRDSQAGQKPHLPLDRVQGVDGAVQCNTCHDPHIRDPEEDVATGVSIKFLRLNRFQKAQPLQGAFNLQNDIICLACHNKAGWADSAHANSFVATNQYTNEAASVREFPQGLAVWESACLACHDTHTVQGSRRLLRGGVDTDTTNVGGYPIKIGGADTSFSAIEETCYACHSSPSPALGLTANVPNIMSDFQLPRHMPVARSDFPDQAEVHNIGETGTPGALDGLPMDAGSDGHGADFLEARSLLQNRHTECTDCHNPHRVSKRRRFSDNAAGSTPNGVTGTHEHSVNAVHDNIASGVLRGAWGVEPVLYANNSFYTAPDNAAGFAIKRGHPGNNETLVSSWVTREYQVCLKCHSNFGYVTPPNLTDPIGGGVDTRTPVGANGMQQYTNQAQEYQSPTVHQGEPLNLGNDGGARVDFVGFRAGGGGGGGAVTIDLNTNNHRSWHPVMNNTGRDPQARGANNNLWITPFNNTGAIGNQTMYCTDCHGNDTANGTAVPTAGNPWGPHGSSNNFILKGQWSGNRPANADSTGYTGTGDANTRSHLCFKCHEFDQYASPAGGVAVLDSGFGTNGGGPGGGCMGGGCMMGVMNNLHRFHAGVVNNFRCNLCHVAIPHGWKNKNFLVNLNDVGPEGRRTNYTQAREVRACTGANADGECGVAYVNRPYYNRASLKIVSFAASHNWQATDCGSSGENGNGVVGIPWMANGNESCQNLP